MDGVGVAVRDWLGHAGLTAADVARRAGVSSSTMHRVLNQQVDPSVGTLREIALACGVEMELTTRHTSDPHACAAARAMLENGYTPPAEPEVAAWRDRLIRFSDAGDPLSIVTHAAGASSPLDRPGATLLKGELPLGRIASAGDASKAPWALSGAAGLYLPGADAAAPRVTVLWSGDARTTVQLLADAGVRQTHRQDRAALAVIEAEPELFYGAFSKGFIRYAAPIQIIVDCIAQGGAVADDALKEARSW